MMMGQCCCDPGETLSTSFRWCTIFPDRTDSAGIQWDNPTDSPLGFANGAEETGFSLVDLPSFSVAEGQTIYLQRLVVRPESMGLYTGYGGGEEVYVNLLGSPIIYSQGYATFAPLPGIALGSPSIRRADWRMSGSGMYYSVYRDYARSFGSIAQLDHLPSSNHNAYGDSTPLPFQYFNAPLSLDKFSVLRGSGYRAVFWIKSMRVNDGPTFYNNWEQEEGNFIRGQGAPAGRPGDPMLVPEGLELPVDQNFSVTVGIAITSVSGTFSYEDQYENIYTGETGPTKPVYQFGDGDTSYRRISDHIRTDPPTYPPEYIYEYINERIGQGIAGFTVPGMLRRDDLHFFYRLSFFPGPGGSNDFPNIKVVDLRGNNTRNEAQGIDKTLVDGQKIALKFGEECPQVHISDGQAITYYGGSEPRQVLGAAAASFTTYDLAYDGETMSLSRPYFDLVRGNPPGEQIVVKYNTEYNHNPWPVTWDGHSTITMLLTNIATRIGERPPRNSSFGNTQYYGMCRYCQIEVIYYNDLPVPDPGPIDDPF